MARNVSVAVSPSTVRSTTSLSICCLMPATRTSKNSSRLELAMQKKLEPFQQRGLGIDGLIEHALVELQPAQLAIDEMFRFE